MMLTFLTSLVALLVLAAARPQEFHGANNKRESPACGITDFSGEYGIIETSGYPNNYLDNLDCLYTIRRNETNFSVNFYTCVCFIEDVADCRWDYLMFSGRSEKLCGNLGSNTYSANSSDGSASITFHSDGSVNYVGCQIVYGINAARSDLVGRCPSQPNATPSFNNSNSSNLTSPAYNWTAQPSNWTSPPYNWTTQPSNLTSPPYNWTTPSSNWTTTSSPNSSVNAMIGKLSDLEIELVNKFNDYRDLLWQIINRLSQV